MMTEKESHSFTSGGNSGSNMNGRSQERLGVKPGCNILFRSRVGTDKRADVNDVAREWFNFNIDATI